MNKIKLALLCHLSNPLIREHLKLTGHHFYFYRDFAIWNRNIINALKERKDIELFVISPHTGMKEQSQEFELEGVNYFFYRPSLPYPWIYLERYIFPQLKYNNKHNRRIIAGFIQRIRPDIVNLIGAENAYYSIAALDINDIPILIHCQTVFANPDRLKNVGSVVQQRWDTEIQLFRKTPYIACAGRMHYDLVKKYAPDATVLFMKWPMPVPPAIKKVPKKYDFVFFARALSKNKGFDKAIEAMGIFHNQHPEARFLAIGGKDASWPTYEERINQLGLPPCLEVHPPFPEYEDVLQYVKQARFALLPISMDVISGTIWESMRLGLPVITFRTSGTPSLNEKREAVMIAERGDVNGLVQFMDKVYTDSSYADRLRENAYQIVREYDDDNAHNVDYMVEQYRAVINHYYNGTPIPRELLFDTDKYRDYRKQ